ncbi:MAG: FeoA family protein [Planctomycetota bacterium]|jgi:Fe2+ transport system protein FeoA
MTDTTLDKVRPGQHATVVDVDLEGAQLQRLLDMGFVEETRVKVVRKAPLFDPFDVEIRGAMVAVRRAEASHVLVREVG